MKARVFTCLSVVGGAIVALSLLMASSQNVQASGASVSGTVYYSTTPLASVRVELVVGDPSDPPVFSTTTTLSGTFSFASVPEGDYWLKSYGPTDQYFLWQARTITVGDAPVHRDIFLYKKMTLVAPPQDSTVETASPVFCWEGLPEAEEYTFQLNKTSDWTLVDFVHHIPGTCYETSQVLLDGVQYTWQIDATNQDGNGVGSTASTFRFVVNTAPVTATVETGSPITISSRDNNIKARLPSGVVSQTATLTYRRSSASPAGHCWVNVDRSFYLTATYEATGIPAEIQPGTSYTIAVEYLDEKVGMDVERTLGLYWWNGNAWSQQGITSSVNVTNNLVTAQVNHFSLFGVLGEAQRVYLPLVLRN
jgi:hypothetical protein